MMTAISAKTVPAHLYVRSSFIRVVQTGKTVASMFPARHIGYYSCYSNGEELTTQALTCQSRRCIGPVANSLLVNRHADTRT